MLIVGAGSLGKEILTIMIEDRFPEEIIFYDENPNIPPILYNKYRVINNSSDLKNIFSKGDNRFITAVGSPRLREKLTRKIELLGGSLSSIISKRTTIFNFNDNYSGVIIQPGVGISYDVEIKEGAAIHINSTIGHCVKIGKYVNIGPNATIIGPSSIGDYSYISAQACLLPNITIGKNVIVTAGKVVDSDLPDYQIF